MAFVLQPGAMLEPRHEPFKELYSSIYCFSEPLKRHGKQGEASAAGADAAKFGVASTKGGAYASGAPLNHLKPYVFETYRASCDP